MQIGITLNSILFVIKFRKTFLIIFVKIQNKKVHKSNEFVLLHNIARYVTCSTSTSPNSFLHQPVKNLFTKLLCCGVTKITCICILSLTILFAYSSYL